MTPELSPEQQQAANQLAYDKALFGLRAQQVAAHDGQHCVYYDPKTGHRCAAGQIMSEEQAKTISEDEVLGVQSAWALKNRNKGLFGEAHINLVIELQSVHDRHMPRPITSTPNNSTIEEWEKVMKLIAQNWRLTYTEPS